MTFDVASFVADCERHEAQRMRLTLAQPAWQVAALLAAEYAGELAHLLMQPEPDTELCNALEARALAWGKRYRVELTTATTTVPDSPASLLDG